VRKPVMSVGLVCGCPAATVWHGFQMLQEMKTAGNTQVYSVILSYICK